MRITVINGQNHKGSTYNIGKLLTDRLSGNVAEFFLPKDFEYQCTGCNRCFTEDENKCPHYEKLKEITYAIDKADVLVFTTPVYVMHCTGQMKSLLDHYGYRFMVHRPEEKMFSKQAVVISTAAGAGMKCACKDITDSLFYWGIPKVFTIKSAVAAVSWDGVKPEKKRSLQKIAEKTAKKLNSGYSRKITIPLKTRFMFNIMRIVQKKFMKNGRDFDYWEEKGWLGKKRPWKN
ncbi:MAG: flavodoxin family protein [Porcipelethomonas sp.]